MSSTNAPFGLRVAYHPSGTIRPAYPMALASGYTPSLYQGTPVTITGGKLALATAGAGNRVAGAFQGVEYIDATGKPNYSTFWPAAQTTRGAVDATAYIMKDPWVVYEIQANGSVAQTNVGNQAAFSASPGSGSTSTGLSSATLDAATLSSSTANQMRVVGISPGADNAFGDAFTVVQVQISQHVDVANQTPY
jgi:hypothetical protein